MRRSPDEVGVLRWSTAEEAVLLIPALPTSSWRRFLLTGFLARLFGTAATFLVEARFTATASFVPVVRGRRGGYAAQMVVLSERSDCGGEATVPLKDTSNPTNYAQLFGAIAQILASTVAIIVVATKL